MLCLYPESYSAVHANNVGLEIPVAIPKIIEPNVYIMTSLAEPTMSILAIKNVIPISRVFLRPILSDKELKNKRTIIVVKT